MLLPTDYPAFSKDDGTLSIEPNLYQCPKSFEWISEWVIDMNGPVDRNGWMYSTNCTAMKHAKCGLFDHFRCRKWVRMRRIISSPEKSRGQDSTSRKMELMALMMRSKRCDRERLEELKVWTSSKENEIDSIALATLIMHEMNHEISRLKFCKMVAPLVSASIKQEMCRNLVYLCDTQELNLL